MVEHRKIGLITFYRDNYGSSLQCFATKNILEHLGYQCVLLNVLPDHDVGAKINKIWRFAFNLIMYRGFLKNRRLMNSAMKKESQLLTSNSQLAIDEFVNER